MEKNKIDLGPLLDDMNKDPFNAAMLKTLQECQVVLAKKRQDYGDHNFIDTAAIASVICGREILPHEVAAILMSIKMARYGNLIFSGKTALHESVEDTLKDLVNYVVLMERERQKYEHKQQAKQETDGASDK